MKREVVVTLSTDTEYGVCWDAREEFQDGPGHDACGEYIGDEIERLLAAGRESDAHRMVKHQESWKHMSNGSQRSARWTRKDLVSALNACHVILRLLGEEKQRLHEACSGTTASQQMYAWLGSRIDRLANNTNKVVVPLLHDAILLIDERGLEKVVKPAGVDAMAVLEELGIEAARPEEHELVPVAGLKGEER
jgi:hypothetical protein